MDAVIQTEVTLRAPALILQSGGPCEPGVSFQIWSKKTIFAE